MLKDEILCNWSTDINEYAQAVCSLIGSGYDAWTVKIDDEYGVAIPYTGENDVNEHFANAKIRSFEIRPDEGAVQRVIMLTTDYEYMKEPFSALCEALIDPGENGEYRKQIEASPIVWWEKWKELLGNRNIDERIYDVLGELCVLRYVIDSGEDARWRGPEGASYDIETERRFIEVKSSVNKYNREITISSQFQLYPPEKPLDLVFCKFEPMIQSGISIDKILLEIERTGYNTDLLNNKLELLGFEKGMSARGKYFALHEMLLYKIDDLFPKVTPESFIGGVMPTGITKITYTVDLTGLTAIALLNNEKNDL